MPKKRQFVSIVVYVHNGADKIITFIDTVMKQCEVFKQCELIFVDDFSSDHSIEIIRRFFNENNKPYTVSILKLGKYHGIEKAMNAGRDMAIGDFVYEFDDLYVDFESDVIMQVYNKCLEGFDIVAATTEVPMKFSSRIFYRIFNKVTFSSADIGQESFRILSRRGINRITSMDIDIPYRKAIYFNSGLSATIIKYKSTTGNRPARITEKYERFDLAFDSFIYFTDIMQRISLYISLFFGLICMTCIVYAIISRGLGYHIGLGWLSMIVGMSLGFIGLFILLTIVIKYLSVIVDLIFKRQKYLIADIEKISF